MQLIPQQQQQTSSFPAHQSSPAPNATQPGAAGPPQQPASAPPSQNWRSTSISQLPTRTDVGDIDSGDFDPANMMVYGTSQADDHTNTDTDIRARGDGSSLGSLDDILDDVLREDEGGESS